MGFPKTNSSSSVPQSHLQLDPVICPVAPREPPAGTHRGRGLGYEFVFVLIVICLERVSTWAR